VKVYKIRYAAGAAFIAHVVVIEEELNHHADIFYRYQFSAVVRRA
jgi:pterin-4a-carbinolamine dehydratase